MSQAYTQPSSSAIDGLSTSDWVIAGCVLLAVVLLIYTRLENTLLARARFVWADRGRDWQRARLSLPRRLLLTWRAMQGGRG